MSIQRFVFGQFGGNSRPVATPTAFSLFAAVALMLAAMFLPDRSERQSAAAAQMQRPLVNVAPATTQRSVSLRDRLVVGLRAMRPSEVAYIDKVVTKVHAGQLPQRIVDETFFWARLRAGEPRRGRDRRPMIYFQPGLTARAARIGVSL